MIISGGFSSIYCTLILSHIIDVKPSTKTSCYLLMFKYSMVYFIYIQAEAFTGFNLVADLFFPLFSNFLGRWARTSVDLHYSRPLYTAPVYGKTQIKQVRKLSRRS